MNQIVSRWNKVLFLCAKSLLKRGKREKNIFFQRKFPPLCFFFVFILKRFTLRFVHSGSSLAWKVMVMDDKGNQDGNKVVK